jgi:putative DNA methylase
MIYPKRLIEVDLPIKRISAHARREKSIRHGHISTLHIWWARRPLAACRAVICASLWIDPVDELCPQIFRDQAVEIITKFAQKAAADGCCSPENWSKWKILVKPENKLDSQNPSHLNILRYRLLDFIADFANWDNSTQPDYLETARALTQAAHEALGGEVGTRPLVVDPFAGGGSIPLEALRVGADAFASDLNPVAVLLNKVVLEYIPKYGQRLADEVRKWGQWVKEDAEKELAEFYPKDEDGSTPIAYLWARTIICEGPNCGYQVPVLGTFLLRKKVGNYVSIKLIKDQTNRSFKTILVTNSNDTSGTARRSSVTCPNCGYTTPRSQVEAQMIKKEGGAATAQMVAVVTTRKGQTGRFYRIPNETDLNAVKDAQNHLLFKIREHNSKPSFIPDEDLPYLRSIFNVHVYGIRKWEKLFSPRQQLAIGILCEIMQKLQIILKEENSITNEFASAILVCIAFAIDKHIDFNSSISRWANHMEKSVATFGRQALGMLWDWGEMIPIGDSTGAYIVALNWCIKAIEGVVRAELHQGCANINSATEHPLPNDSAACLITDPPYYDAVPYADLSDYFYVWLKRSLNGLSIEGFSDVLTPKEKEIVQLSERNKEYAYKTKDRFEELISISLSQSRRYVSAAGIGVVVFAHKTTEGWEAMLEGLIRSGWIVTASWTIDTEKPDRLRAQNSAALASSVHLVCRPRENPDGTLREEIGDWRDVLQELPKRIKEWMPRLTEQGVVGADAIFACLGPALEIFSRYSSVEKASGEIVPLREYLEYVWAAISKEALSTIFKDADTSNFEEDARLTAMWLWTLSAGEPSPPAPLPDGEGSEDDDDDENTSKKPKITGFSLEYDTARKIAQGLGAHLENLTHLVEVKGDKARLLPVKERAAYLFGKEGIIPDIPKKKAKGDKQLTLIGVLDELPEDEHGEVKISRIGETICDKVHQAMLLFNSGRSEALKRFLVDEAIGKDIKFWQLAQSFSALYPAGTDEKRWVDGLLARKKGLGL